MTSPFHVQTGDSPLLVSIPHDGRTLAPDMEGRMTLSAKSLPDTDWHVQQLYKFAVDYGANFLVATYSRYVVDLNRPTSDASLYEGHPSSGVCPKSTFAGESIYLKGKECSDSEKQRRVRCYWQPYHDQLAAELARIRERFGYALLWDAHSIRSEIANLFEGALPVLNIGTNDGASCHPALVSHVVSVAENSDYSFVLDGRFKGGYITRAYGDPAQNVHAIQLELAQNSYMNEDSYQYDVCLASKVRCVLKAMLKEFQKAARELV